MMLRSKLRKGWPAAVIALVLGSSVSLGVLGCNSHKFQPAASMELSPVVVAYEAQRKDNYIKEILISNDGVAASLEVYGFWFNDQQRKPFDLLAVKRSEQPIQDQVVLKTFIERYRQIEDTTLTTTYLSQGVIVEKPDVACKTDADCYCDKGSTPTCIGKLGSNDIGQPFSCVAHPLDVRKTACVGYFKFINNAGLNRETRNLAGWGGLGRRESDKQLQPCTSNAECTSLGSDYKCLKETTDTKLKDKCGTDIKLLFGTDFGLEHMAFAKMLNTKEEDGSALVGKERAAIWKAVDPLDGGLCLADSAGGTPTPITFYGLNRCDQQALKWNLLNSLMTNVDTELDSNSYVLYPKSRANLAVMAMPKTSSAVESRGLVKDGLDGRAIVFCNNTSKPVTHVNIRLEEQQADIDSATCITADGKPDESRLSVRLGNLRLNQLPVRLVYQVDNTYSAAQPTLSSKLFNMAIESNATQSSESTKVQISLPKTAGGPPLPVIRLDVSQSTELANPEPLKWMTLTGLDSYNPMCSGALCDENTPDPDMTARRKPYSYKWTITKFPNFATDVHLLKISDAASSQNFVEGTGWNKELPKVKMFAAVSGEYVFELQVKDNSETPSGPNAACPGCWQTATLKVIVKPSQQLHVEMLWDKGAQTDMDLFLVRYRDNGTFGYSSDNAIVDVAQPIMPSCTGKADCFGGALECGPSKTCTNACTGDAVCKQANAGWICKDNTCQVSASNEYIPCKVDSDCGLGKYCNPLKKLGEWILACTNLPNDAINDTVFYNNRDPRWGEYVAAAGAEACTTSDTCMNADDNAMCGWDKSAPGKCAINNKDDDPTLDIDDVTGWGPENISVKMPKAGRYRVVARFWADGTNIVSSKNPNSYLTASVRIYLMGEDYFGGVGGLTHEFSEAVTYWKVADINWQGTEKTSKNTATPVCAGWTRTTCSDGGNELCAEAYKSSAYTCQERNWEGKKYCNTCGDTMPDADRSPTACFPTKVCNSNSDCADQSGGATSCNIIAAKYCRCDGAAEFAQFKTNPYANPALVEIDEMIMNPTAASGKRSIWCDKADDVIDSVSGTKCSAIYAAP